jgi:hypothetical protein
LYDADLHHTLKNSAGFQTFAPAADSTVQVLYQLSSTDPGAISKLKLWKLYLQEKVKTRSQLQCYCCLDAETVLLSRCGISINLKNKAKRL